MRPLGHRFRSGFLVGLGLFRHARRGLLRAKGPPSGEGQPGRGQEAPQVPGKLSPASGTPRAGYYRHPAIYRDTILFTAEGALWEVGTDGGAARRLTSGAGTELFTAISPDGRTVAFSASYEGPKDVYTMPIGGGVPQRRTWGGESFGSDPTGDEVAGWMPDGRLLVRSWRYSTLPDSKLVAFDDDGGHEIIPLAQASEGVFTPDGKTLFFTRLPRQGSQTKRYQGGTAENLWRFEAGTEAVPLTADWAGTSHNPMFWSGRVYFLSDRDGVMNVYSMDREGIGLRPETHHHGMDAQYASLSEGRIVYQLGADLWLLDLKTGHDAGSFRSRSSPISGSAPRTLGEEPARIPHRRPYFPGRERGRLHRARRGIHPPAEGREDRQGRGRLEHPLPRSEVRAGWQEHLRALDADRGDRVLEIPRERSQWRRRREQSRAVDEGTQTSCAGTAWFRRTAAGSPTGTKTSSSGCTTSRPGKASESHNP